MKCKDCKHWTTEAPYQLPNSYKSRMCGSAKLVEEFWDDDEALDMLHYSYAEGGAFYTGPEFGCVHFEGGKG